MTQDEPFSGYTADIWAAGVVLFVFVTGQVPFFAESPTELFELIAENNLDLSEYGMSDELREVLTNILDKDPRKRISIGELLNHPFLSTAKQQRDEKHGEDIASSMRNMINVDDLDHSKAFSSGGS